MNESEPRRDSRLEPVEIEILRLVSEGRRNEEIARQLSYSVDTIKWRLKEIFSVLEVGNRIAAVNRARERGILTDTSQVLLVPQVNNPFRGLKTFQTSDATYFFGRESLVQQIIPRLTYTKGITPFLTIVGPSGIGKSSLVNAGLIPELLNGTLQGTRDWTIVRMTPGSHPMSHLVESLQAAIETHPDIATDSPRKDAVLNHFVEHQTTRPMLLVVDQYEELYSLVRDEGERSEFNQFLTGLLRANLSRIYLIILIRADFLDRPLQDTGLGPYLDKHVQFVTALDVTELEQVTVKPAAVAGLTIEPGLATSIVTEIYQQPGALPLLQFVLAELFEQRQENKLTLASYQMLGGATGALTRQVELIYQNFDAPGQEFTRRLFLDMVSMTQTGDFTRRRTRLTAIRQLAESEAVLENVIDTFVAKRILILGWDDSAETAIVEMAHEALITLWPRLNEWCNENREALRFKQQLERMAEEWVQLDRDDASLLAGVRLERAVRLLSDENSEIADTTRNFIETSQRHDEALKQKEKAQIQRELMLQRRSLIRTRLIAVILAMFLISAGALLVYSTDLRQRADANAMQANTNAIHADSLRLAASANAYLPGSSNNAEIAALLAIQSLKTGYSPEADKALLQASSLIYTERYFRLANEYGDIVSNDGTQRLTAYGSVIVVRDLTSNQVIRTLKTNVSGSIFGLAQSPDGRLLAAATKDGTVLVIDITSGKTIQRTNAQAVQGDAFAFTPNNQWLMICQAATDNDQVVGLNLTDSTSVVIVPKGSDCGSNVLQVSSDSQYLLDGSESVGAILYKIPTGEKVQVYPSASVIYGLAISPDGKYVATGDTVGLIRLWERSSGREVRQFIGHTTTVWGLGFSPDGKYLASGSEDHSVIIWDVATGKQLRQYTGEHDEIDFVEFLPNDKLLAWSSTEKDMRIFDARLDHSPNRLGQFSDESGGIALSTDGRYLAESLLTGCSASLIDQTTGKVLFKTPDFSTIPGIADTYHCTVDISRDGQKLLAARPDGFSEYQIPDGHLLRNYTEPNLTTSDRIMVAHNARYSPDGNYIISTGYTLNVARLWSTQSGQLLESFDKQKGWLRDAVFSPDGKTIVTAADDETAVVWTLNGEVVTVFDKQKSGLYALAFSPKGDIVVSSASDGSIWLWNPQNGTPIRTFHVNATDHYAAALYRIGFADNGNRLVISDADGNVDIWDVSSGQQLRQFTAQSDMVYYFAISPDGKGVLTAGGDSTINQYDVNIDDTVASVCNQSYQDFTPQERQTLHISTSTPTCPNLAEPMTYATIDRMDYETAVPDTWTFDGTTYNTPDQVGGGLTVSVNDVSNKPALNELASTYNFSTQNLKSDTIQANGLQWTLYSPFDNGTDTRLAFAVAESNGKQIVLSLNVPITLYDQTEFEQLYQQTLLVTVKSFKLKPMELF